MKKYALVALAGLVVIVVAGAVLAWVAWQDMSNQISSPYDEIISESVLLTIQPGTSTSDLSLIHI